MTVAYINPRTGATWPVDTPLWQAPDDGGYVNLTPGAGLQPEAIVPERRSLWRYAPGIRVAAAGAITLGEGWTPLLPAVWNGRSVWMKAEFMMPSGSFKDRGMAVLVSYLKQAGVPEILEDSSGNAGASVATYAAAAGMRCRIFVPAAAPIGKRMQMAAMGASVVPVAGSREDVATAALEAARDAFYAGHNWQPFFLEGTKTLAFELWEQLGFTAPDVVVTPIGQGSNVMGCYLGFGELRAAGLIDRMPRIYGVQAANCAPYHAAFRNGGRYVPIVAQPTMADGISSEKPVRLPEVMAGLTETGGATVAVSEDEIVAALRRLAALGYFVEPTSAAVGAGLSRLIADGSIAAGETVCVVLTGTGLKAVDKIGAALGLTPG